MTSKYSLTIFFVIISYLVSFGQNSKVDLTVVTEAMSKEISKIVATQKKITTNTKELTLEASIWPNPSNIGKVRLSVENLPKGPLFIQIFNGESELIQEGEINGPKGASLHHILNLPDTTGSYSIVLSDYSKIIKDLDLEIL